MRPDGTIDPLLLARDLDGLYGLDRIAMLRVWISAASATAIAVGHDTAALLNASASVLWLYRMLDQVPR